MQREYLKSNLPLPVSSAEDDHDDDDDGKDILIRRSASGVFRYSSPSISQSNTANNGCKKSKAQQLQKRSSTNGEQCSNHPGEVISHTTTQGDGSSNSLTVSRHNMEPEKSARSDDGKSRQMVVQENAQGVNDGCVNDKRVGDTRYFDEVSSSDLRSINTQLRKLPSFYPTPTYRTIETMTARMGTSLLLKEHDFFMMKKLMMIF